MGGAERLCFKQCSSPKVILFSTTNTVKYYIKKIK
jgi:hypothetical protein